LHIYVSTTSTQHLSLHDALPIYDVDTRELIEWVLRRVGAEVTSVGSAREALEALEREKPHILVTDIAMPEEDGHSLLKKIRALRSEDTRLNSSHQIISYAVFCLK